MLLSIIKAVHTELRALRLMRIQTHLARATGGLLTPAPGLELLKSRVVSDSSAARIDRLSVISTNTRERWRPVSSCQVKGQTNRVTVGMPLGLSTGHQSSLKQDASAASADLMVIWCHSEMHQRRPTIFLHSGHMDMGAFIIQYVAVLSHLRIHLF